MALEFLLIAENSIRKPSIRILFLLAIVEQGGEKIMAKTEREKRGVWFGKYSRRQISEMRRPMKN